MLFVLILIVAEILTILVLKEHFRYLSKLKLYLSFLIHGLLSIWLWFAIIKVSFYKGYFDAAGNIRMRMNLTGMVCAVVFPRCLLCFLHFSGKLIRIKRSGHIRWMTKTGIIISVFILSVITFGTLAGRFNFKTEEVTIKIQGLDPELNGLKIVHISDLHLAGFHRHLNRLQEAMDEVNSYQPDLIINTGDFISYGWREFNRCDTILAKAKSQYGNYAVPGNHDMGTYFPGSSEADKKAIALKVNELITASGYNVLNDEHIFLKIKGIKIAIIGVETSGRHPDIIHGDLQKAKEGIDSVDFQILLIHDPNQWKEDVTGKTGIDLTFAGHTHGMQIGIVTKKFRWSPSKHFYPEWNGLFSEDNQYLYVNRGLGVLAIPFRIWMPPEITVLTLVTE